MKIYIVRHSDKERTKNYNHYLRHEDPPLSEAGKKKAQKLFNYFNDIPIKKIIVSEYIRTYETAQYIAAKKGLSIFKDKRLNEIDNGIIESMSDKKIQEKYPDFFKDFFSYSKDTRFPEGETGEEVRLRQKALLEQLLLEKEDVLLFSHEGYIRLLMCHLLNLPVYKRYLFHVNTCGITELEYISETNVWRINRFNQVIPE